MSVLILLEAEVKMEAFSMLQTLLGEMLPVTRKQDGCHSIDVYIDSQKPDTLMLVENWDTLKQYKKYRLWRIKSGIMEKLSGMFKSPPSIRILEAV